MTLDCTDLVITPSTPKSTPLLDSVTALDGDGVVIPVPDPALMCHLFNNAVPVDFTTIGGIPGLNGLLAAAEAGSESSTTLECTAGDAVCTMEAVVSFGALRPAAFRGCVSTFCSAVFGVLHWLPCEFCSVLLIFVQFWSVSASFGHSRSARAPAELPEITLVSAGPIVELTLSPVNAGVVNLFRLPLQGRRRLQNSKPEFVDIPLVDNGTGGFSVDLSESDDFTGGQSLALYVELNDLDIVEFAGDGIAQADVAEHPLGVGTFTFVGARTILILSSLLLLRLRLLPLRLLLLEAHSLIQSCCAACRPRGAGPVAASCAVPTACLPAVPAAVSSAALL